MNYQPQINILNLIQSNSFGNSNTNSAKTHEDYYNLMVANYILGGSGFGSWLMEEIREKRGLSYSVYSYISSNKTHGYLKISLQTKNEKFISFQKHYI